MAAAGSLATVASRTGRDGRTTDTSNIGGGGAALLHPNGAGLSDTSIAEHVGVSHPFVGKLRKDLEDAGSLVTVTSRIGKASRAAGQAANVSA